MKVILAQPRGFCAGVVRAIEIVERALQKYGAAGLRAPRDRAQQARRREPARPRARCSSRSCPRSRRTPSPIFSAHGVAKSVEDEAATRGLPVLDATCPLVTKVHNQGKRYVAQGRTAHPDRPCRPSRGRRHDGPDRRPGASWCRPRRTSTRSTSPTDTPVAYVTQTTLCVDDTTRHHRRAAAPLHRHRRAGDARHLLRDAEPPDGGARACASWST